MKINTKMFSDGLKVMTKFISKNGPTIAVVAGVGMMIGAVVETIIEAPKAKEELADLEEDTKLCEQPVSTKEYIGKQIKIVAKHYWPTVFMTASGVVLIFWGHKNSLGRTAAALAAYQMTKDDLKKLEDKIIEMDGEKHLEKAKDEIAKDRIAANMSEPIMTGKGNIKFVDCITGQVFYSSFDAIERAVNALNAKLLSSIDNSESLNTWLDLIGCRTSDIGDKLGWNYSAQGDSVSVKYRCVKDPDTLEVTHYICYNIEPIWDFDCADSSDWNARYGR